MKKIILATCLLNIQSFAIEPSLFTSSYEKYDTSDKYSISTYTLDWQNNRRDLFWGYPGNLEDVTDYGVSFKKRSGDFKGDIESEELSGRLGRKMGFDQYVLLNVGLHNLTYKNKESSHATYNLKYQLKRKEFNIQLMFDHNLYFIEKGVTTPLTDSLKQDYVEARFNYLGKKNFRIPISVKSSSISDSNKSNQQKIAVLYGRSYPTWIWGGYGVERLSFSKKVTGYWSPKKVLSHGPRIEVGHTFMEKLNLGGSYSYSFNKEDSFAEGKSIYASLKAEYGRRENWLTGLSYYISKSKQGTSNWRGEGVRAYLNISF